MSEIKGCMNCGNISCGNNKKRESAGCGRWISPEDKKMIKDEMKNRISMALKDAILQQGFEIICKNLTELEKENAELKKKYVKNITDCDICDTYCNSQLIKAKELLKQWLQTSKTSSCDNINIVTDTEQFLNSEVVK